MENTLESQQTGGQARSVVEFLAQFPRVESYAEIDEILRSPAFHQGSHFESRPVYGGSLVVIDGPEHRERRRRLMALFRHDMLRRLEREILQPGIASMLARTLADKGADGVARVELVGLLRNLLIGISAGVTGVDDADAPERKVRLMALVAKLEAASGVEWTARDPAEVLADGITARGDLVREFLQPSLERRLAICRRIDAGEGCEEELPADLLSVLAREGERGAEGDDDYVWRECALFLVAGTQTTSHALPHVVWHLDQWLRQHPDDLGRLLDDEFLRAAANESLRLHQPVPALLRLVVEDVELKSSGRRFQRGERIALYFSSANRDDGLFGADVEGFDPHRPMGKRPPPWGLTFGSGVHTCIGRALVTGLSRAYDDADPTRGSIVGILKALYGAGARLDPDWAPRRNTESFHDAFASMWLRFDGT